MSFSGLEQVKLLNLLEHASIGVVIHAHDTSVIYANPTALRLLRVTYNQIIGKDAYDPQWKFVDENQNNLSIDEYPACYVINRKQSLYNRILGVVDSRHHDISWFNLNAYYEGNIEDACGFVVVSFFDISDQKKLFSFEDILHNTQDIVIVTDALNIDRPLGPKIIYVNKAFEELTGYRADEAIGETPRILQGKDTDRATLDRIRAAMEKQQSCKEKVLNYAKDGTPYWLELHIIPLKNRFGEVTHFAAIERDVTSKTHYALALEQRNNDLRALRLELERVLEERTEALRSSNAQLMRLANEDSLTGLCNRKAFLEQSTQQIARAKRNNLCLGIAILDLDHFKLINDQFGHDMGDHVLQLVANTFSLTLRQEDIVGRIGGEEFGICMIAPNQLMIEESLLRLLEAVRHTAEDQPFAPLTASIGLSYSDASHTQQLSELLKQADIALYQAKRDGRDQVCCFHHPTAT